MNTFASVEILNFNDLSSPFKVEQTNRMDSGVIYSLLARNAPTGKVQHNLRFKE